MTGPSVSPVRLLSVPVEAAVPTPLASLRPSVHLWVPRSPQPGRRWVRTQGGRGPRTPCAALYCASSPVSPAWWDGECVCECVRVRVCARVWPCAHACFSGCCHRAGACAVGLLPLRKPSPFQGLLCFHEGGRLAAEEGAVRTREPLFRVPLSLLPPCHERPSSQGTSTPRKGSALGRAMLTR